MAALVVDVIAGVRLELVAGVRYRASRPFAERGRRVYPVTIEPIEPGADAAPVVVDGLELEAATALVGAFNIGPTSFDGRVWGPAPAAAWPGHVYGSDLTPAERRKADRDEARARNGRWR